MEVEIFALCDGAAEYGDRLNILGVFDAFYARHVPATHPQCSIALRLRVGDQLHHQLTLQIVDEQGQQIRPPLNGQFQVQFLGSEQVASVNVIADLQDLPFRKYGEYQIKLLVDDQPLVALPFTVRQPEALPST